MLNLSSSIEYIKGVGSKRAQLLREELNIHTVKDILQLVPIRYEDKSKFYKINKLTDGVQVQIAGTFVHMQEKGIKRSKRLSVIFQDGTGQIELVWFKGINYIKKRIVPGSPMVIYGKVSAYGSKLTISHPEIETLENFKINTKLGLHPIYPSTEKLKNSYINHKLIGSVVQRILRQLPILPEFFSDELKLTLKLIDRKKAYETLHFPLDLDQLKWAQFRLKFEELFFQQISLFKKKLIRRNKFKSYPFENVGDYFQTFYNDHLPFTLTNAQKRVVKEIRNDLGRNTQMNRLLQGDVGAGKTMVGFLCVLIALDNNFQTCLMAPTEILASQHYEGLREYTDLMDIHIELLTGSTKQAKRRQIHKDLENGSLQLLIGTHALLEDKVRFKNLGLAIIDEQHRFGVAQRAKMWKKNNLPPHVLVMTATPIPRTLAMTAYGDLDVSVIDELPSGRKPIKTVAYKEESRLAVFGFIRKQIKEGRQVYIVYPLIQESEKLDYKNLQDGYESIVREFPLPEYRVSIVHGQMKPEDKAFEMKRFVKGETQIMVATTVIEVGVNVPNATVMVIESVERFGLSQLHQLRGRVGRGGAQSYCILMTNIKQSKVAQKRIETMCETNDGFKVAEVDLELRGPGDIMGTRQSGELNLKIANIITDAPILSRARQEAQNILNEDPGLTLPKNKPIKQEYEQYHQIKTLWSNIS